MRDCSVSSEDADQGYSQHNMATKDDVCVVGMACHLPGGVISPSSLWDFLTDKRSGQGLVPPERFNMAGFYNPDGSRAGVMESDGGYFLQEDVKGFENSFFGINNLEATHMDPQQRKLLEVVYECFENAGLTLDQISGTNTGVYVGNFTVDCQTIQLRDPDSLRRYMGTGLGTTILANRISHVFNLQGPSFSLDTACSSSLYALHNAVVALATGDCESAIVAGVNLILSPEQGMGTAKMGVLSPTSTCHTFDASADGYGRAEAVNAVYLKPLSAALRDNDKIWAVIRGTAINANGKTPGITLPSASQQEVVIQKAYANAGIEFGDTDYIECHGTGTPVGDPIEVEAVSRCLAHADRGTESLLIGSSKPNFGHSEAASGLTSVIKVALALDRGLIPPTRGVDVVNPKLKLDLHNIRIVTETEAWPRKLQRASVNAFGYGGANAHVILESFGSYLNGLQVDRGTLDKMCNSPEKLLDTPSLTSSSTSTNGSALGRLDHDQLLVIPVSAASDRSLQDQIKHTHQTIKLADAKTLRNLAFTLANHRTHFRNRHTILAKAKLDGTCELVTNIDDNIKAPPNTSDPLPLGYMFTGQGAQHATMASDLLHTNPTFLATIRDLDDILQSLPPHHAPSWTLEQTLLDPPETSQIDHVTRSQPACTAVQIALVNVLRSWGTTVRPSKVIGHSSGEIAAAYAGGLLIARQAILVAYFRGHAVGQLKTKGAMLAITGMDATAANKLIQEKGLQDQVCVACVNAPESLTLSGSVEGIEIVRAEMEEQKKFARKLRTGGRAYHSHMMSEVGELYEQLITPLFVSENGEDQQHDSSSSSHRDDATSTPPDMFSTVGHADDPSVGAVLTRQTAASAKYWRRNLEQPVQFSLALERMTSTGPSLHLLEIGPHSALKGPVEQTLARMNRNTTTSCTPLYTPTLIRNLPPDLCLANLTSTLYHLNHPLSWSDINPHPLSLPIHNIKLHNLPPYPWDYTSSPILWYEPRSSHEIRTRPYPRHELLGSRQVAGNGLDWNWRNVLHLDEVPWLRDHKLETQIVFPAAGYLCMVVEGLRQIMTQRGVGGYVAGTLEEWRGFSAVEFRNVNIRAALVVEEEGGPELELHTAVVRRKLSSGVVSGDWFDFEVVSWVGGQSTVHCVGRVRVLPDADVGRSMVLKEALELGELMDGFVEWSGKDAWYDKLAGEGLCFRESFRSIEGLRIDATRARREAVCKTSMSPPAATDAKGTRYYPVHPITIDACLQMGIMSAAAGSLSSLRVHLPDFIDACLIRMPRAGPQSSSTELGEIQARATVTGVSTSRMDCALRDARDTLMIQFQQVRIVRYTAQIASGSESKEGTDSEFPRQPCLRVQWKPDIRRMDISGGDMKILMAGYVNRFVESLGQDDAGSEIADDEFLAGVAGVLDLAGHKNPGMRVLELGEVRGCKCKSEQWMGFLGEGTGFRRFGTWRTGKVDGAGEVVLDDEGDDRDEDGDEVGVFDVVLIPGRSTSQEYLGRFPGLMASLLGRDGILIARGSETEMALSNGGVSGFAVTQVTKKLLFATALGEDEEAVALKGQDVVIIVRDSITPNTERLVKALSTHIRGQMKATNVQVLPLNNINQLKSWKTTICISLLEIEKEFLASINQHDLDNLRIVTDQTTRLLWLTGANQLGPNPDPNLTLSNGLSRTLMMEQPALRFAVLDIGAVDLASTSNADILSACTSVISALQSHDDNIDDKEFVWKDGLLHISRFGPDFLVNSLFRRRLGVESKDCPVVQAVSLATARQARLAIKKAGMSESIHFQEICEPRCNVPPTDVEVQVRAVSLNAKDVYALNGRVETRGGATCLEFAGVVTAVGSEVENLQLGDRVVVGGFPTHFETTIRVPASVAHKLMPGEDLATMVTIPVIYATALYALREQARLRPGESVLIHSGGGAFGMAAIAVAKNILGANVYTTAGSPSKRELVAKQCGLSPGNVFSSRDASFMAGVKAATGRRGVDVVLNSLTGDLMHSSWECLAPFGRFVEVGKRELVDAGVLDMHVFSQGASFTAFDLSELFFQEDRFHRDLLRGIIGEVLGLYRGGKIAPVPTTVFPVGEVVQAYRYFSSRERVGKIVISLKEDNARIPLAPSRYHTLLDHAKVYLLVGCLGGLGRSLSRWMLDRGARHFVFLGRSGSDKPDARALVSRLEAAGASVTVVRGDVADPADVVNALKACHATGLPVGGIIQGAMGLHEGLFSRMTAEEWQKAVRPKWAGTWNLHTALEDAGCHGKSLDFFLLMSSVSGSMGTPTESNYCAANGFLDAFARWRRSQGKPGVAIGLGMISEVGYLHENPEIEALLRRRGVQPLSEDEFLQVIDLAIGSELTRGGSRSLDLGSAHLLTGLEPFGTRRLRDQGFEVKSSALDDPRASVLAAALEAGLSGSKQGASRDTVAGHGEAAAWFKALPGGKVAQSLASESDAPSVQEAVLRLTRKRFSSLVLMPTDQIDIVKPLAGFGMDSMIASEFRAWFWTTFRVDVPFLDLLSPVKTLGGLAEFVGGRLSE